MRQLRAILVDDEQLALTRLSRSLEAVEGIEVVGATTSARQALSAIEDTRPDLVFLDIAMPGMTGFDIVGQLRGEGAPAVIFVTAYDNYAVQAFGVDAVDYLLKPVAPERLRAAVARARARLDGRGAAGAEHGGGLPEKVDDDVGVESLWAHRHREFVRVRIDDIEWIEANGDYVRLHGGEGGGLIRMTLSALEARLDEAIFIRVHRSAICRRSAIAGVKRKPTGALVATLASGDEAPVGRSFGGGLRALLRKMQA